ncbi:CHAT domain-containing protein [Actinocrispum wychmicini]|uniref:CHAT domain-containing protein n=1 Tax=Actinocrispum wychmicini TaxID=1213861 RepID=A0A4R2K032_9PSEU|nr:CHAT domain-containing protein [Actinocrispum wychmicini]TCO59685.1 CHAT domain-containing protein [Actinocrispum wychmicini]
MVTVQVTYVDAGNLYVSWRWEHDPDHPRVLILPRDRVGPPLAELADALPTPRPGESAYQALTRALSGGALTDRDRERVLATNLAAALIPAQLARELDAVILAGDRLHVRVQPSPSTAQVPWEALRVDEAERFVHNANVSILTPATVRNARARRLSPNVGPLAAAVDPPTPLGRVLGEVPEALATLDVLDRDTLRPALAEAGRFLYVGHVTTAAHALDARLHLARGTLTAADLLGWRIPNRAALIACESGADHRYAEPSGLVAALVHGGAEYVTATRWVLPTDAGMTRLFPGFHTPTLAGAVLAVHNAQEQADPVAALNDWQREQADRWESTGAPEFTPLVWAALGATYAPAPP